MPMRRSPSSGSSARHTVPRNHADLVLCLPWRRITRKGASLALTFEAMPSVQVKDVPDDVHATLRRRAAIAGQSLQEYLLGRLIDEARSPTLDEVLGRAEQRTGGRANLASAANAVRSDRDAQ